MESLLKTSAEDRLSTWLHSITVLPEQICLSGCLCLKNTCIDNLYEIIASDINYSPKRIAGLFTNKFSGLDFTPRWMTLQQGSNQAQLATYGWTAYPLRPTPSKPIWDSVRSPYIAEYITISSAWGTVTWMPCRTLSTVTLSSLFMHYFTAVLNAFLISQPLKFHFATSSTSSTNKKTLLDLPPAKNIGHNRRQDVREVLDVT